MDPEASLTDFLIKILVAKSEYSESYDVYKRLLAAEAEKSDIFFRMS